jgi:hypothetical protein
VAAVRIWIAADHDAAHQNGGWAFVRAGEALSGWAGGDRRTTRARMALAGLTAALKDLPAGASLAVVAPPADARVLHSLLRPPEVPPTEDLDLRAALTAALAGVAWRITAGDPKAATPLAFAAAWADLSSGKARTGGAFTAAIPKSNLAKVAGL